LFFKSNTDPDVLFDQARKGSQKAASELSRQLGPKLYAQALHKLRNAQDAEDVAQNALIKLWQKAPEWTSEGAKVTTWLYTVTNNLCIDMLRKRKNTVGDDALNETEDTVTPTGFGHLNVQQSAKLLNDALEELPERQQTALKLKFYQNLSNPQIAQEMDLSVDAVESLLARAKRSLKDHLQHNKDNLF
jgi:RNA polymerase sigma-70 factor (ECF subfamily)